MPPPSTLVLRTLCAIKCVLGLLLPLGDWARFAFDHRVPLTTFTHNIEYYITYLQPFGLSRSKQHEYRDMQPPFRPLVYPLVEGTAPQLHGSQCILQCLASAMSLWIYLCLSPMLLSSLTPIQQLSRIDKHQH